MISVIIPAYNVADKISKIFQCLNRQTENDLEIIVVDDGSIDDLEKLCKKTIINSNMINYIKQKKAGVAAARNYGLKIASGDYIAFLDADDLIENNYFEELLTAISDADIAVCDVVVNEDKTEIMRFSESNEKMNSISAINLLLTRKRINSGPCGKLFRKEIVKNISFPNLKVYEDILFVLEAFAQAKIIVSTNKTEYHYLQNTGSAMHKLTENPSLDIVEATDQIVQFILANTQLEKECFYITMSHLFQYVKLYDKNSKKNFLFLKAVRNIYKKYYVQLLKCPRYTWKERILYTLFVLGIY